MQEWQIKICKEPHAVTGQLIKPGKMVMGKQSGGDRLQFDVENAQEIDRKIQ